MTTRITLEQDGGVTFDRFNSLEIQCDVASPWSLDASVGDDRSGLNVLLGKKLSVRHNGVVRFVGFLYYREYTATANDGGVLHLMVNSPIQSAQMAAANAGIRVERVSLGKFLRELWAPLGVTFVFDASGEADLLTGKGTTGGNSGKDVEKITPDKAKVQPGETIWDCTQRHLKRHGLHLWDAPNGSLIVSKPNDEAGPTYTFKSRKGRGISVGNNIISARRINDAGSIPTAVTVVGAARRKTITPTGVATQAPTAAEVRKSITGFSAPLYAEDSSDTEVVSPVSGPLGDNAVKLATPKKTPSEYTVTTPTIGVAYWDEVFDSDLHQPILILDDQIKSMDQAAKAASRELKDRSARMDQFEITVDGWDYRVVGAKPVPYTVNTTAQVEIDGLANGTYYVHRVNLSADASNSLRTTLTLSARGTFAI